MTRMFSSGLLLAAAAGALLFAPAAANAATSADNHATITKEQPQYPYPGPGPGPILPGPIPHGWGGDPHWPGFGNPGWRGYPGHLPGCDRRGYFHYGPGDFGRRDPRCAIF